jgi:plasmid stabilization system protein ParE
MHIPENAAASDLAARFDRMQEEYRRNSEEQRRVIQELSVQVAALSVNPRQVRHRSRTPGRNRARSQSRGRGNPNHCFYHQKFGAKTRKCEQPCTFHQENPTGSQQ